MKDLYYRCGVVLSSEPQIWKFHVVVWQTTSKYCTKKRAAHAARFFFRHSTKQIIDLWRRRCRCCRHFLNSLLRLKLNTVIPFYLRNDLHFCSLTFELTLEKCSPLLKYWSTWQICDVFSSLQETSKEISIFNESSAKFAGCKIVTI